MVVWGGSDAVGSFNTGARYNPSTDTWTSVSAVNAPSARYLHTAVYAGSLMIVWGGYDGTYLDTGGRYDPANNTWSSTATTNAPAPRYRHSAVWSGTFMIVWGGREHIIIQ